MSKNKGKRDYDKEIADAAKRMQKHKEHLEAARNSQEWKDFLLDIGVNPDTIESKSGSDFWENVRKQIPTKQYERRSVYQEARLAGMPAKLARRIRDWSRDRAEREIDRWQARY